MSGGRTWWVYLLRCADGTLYAGMTDDVDRRAAVHNSGRGAKYTRGRRPVEPVYRERCESRSAALKREAALKKLSRRAKLALVAAQTEEEGEPMEQRSYIRFLPSGEAVEAVPGESVMEAARRTGLWLDSPCGGRGTCGKCRVELRRPGGAWESVLACQTGAGGGMEVRLPDAVGGMDILTAGGGRTVAADPLVRWTAVPGPERGCRTLWEGLVPALTEALGGPPETPGLPVLRDLGALPEGTERIWALHAGREVLALTAEEPKPLLLAFDLGTTTLAGFLLDGITGETLAVGSAQNPQAAYGADVIARIDAAAREGVEPLRAAVRQGMLQVAEDMAARTGRALGDVVLTVLAGNTCMHHLALGIPPATLGAAPYVPVARAGMLLPAEETGLPVHPAGKLAMLPDLAGFVGADTAACLLAAEFDRREELTLLLDIGTNGEMVLGDRHRRIACSTAAGPAFEGAKLRCGMRGTAGAIDHVRLAEGRLSVHVVGEGRARGICGSGLLDAAAALLESGLMDESGALLEPEELEDAALADRLTEIDGMPAVVLAPAEDSVDGSPVVLTQMDIRELQLAKAAVAAGIRLMAEDFGAALEDIGTVLIAGAFGNFMDPESALRIGLLPRELAGKLHMIGNAAGAGACLAARNGGELARCEALADGTDYLELAVHRGFSDFYLEEMSFPER